MRLSNLLWIVTLFVILCAGRSFQHPSMIRKREDSPSQPFIEYDDMDAALNDQLKRLGQYNLNSWNGIAEDGGFQRVTQCVSITPMTSSETYETPFKTTITTCQPPPPTVCNQYQQQQQYPQQQQQSAQQQSYDMDDSELRGRELRELVQHLYVAQARVQLEATEIHKAQAVANSAQAQLEDSSNHVRTITATLHNAQQEVAAAAIRAQIAQLQLAAHDQLLFAARQDVDSLSSQVVGLQAAEGIVQPKLTVDLHALLEKLRQPLQHFDRPTPVPMIIIPPPLNEEPPQPAPDSGEGVAMGVPYEAEPISNNKEVINEVQQAIYS